LEDDMLSVCADQGVTAKDAVEKVYMPNVVKITD
jgi:hypothetical protein